MVTLNLQTFMHFLFFAFRSHQSSTLSHIFTSTDSGPRDPRPADRLTIAVSEAAGKRRKEEGGAVGLSGMTILN